MLFQFEPQVNHVGMEATSAQDAIRQIGEGLFRTGYVKESYVEAVLEREKNYPTGLPFEGAGIALPHTDAEHVMRPIIAIATLKRTVPFQNMGDASQSVDTAIVVMLAMKNSEFQLTLLSRLIETLQDTAFVRELLAAESQEALASKMSDKINGQ